MSERPTPETDDQPIIYAINDNGYQVPCVDIEFARKLKRELAEAFELLASEKTTRNHIIQRGIKMQQERDEAREALADWENAAAHVEADHPDERHCGCVPVLRKLLADARKERDEAREALEYIASAGLSARHIQDYAKEFLSKK